MWIVAAALFVLIITWFLCWPLLDVAVEGHGGEIFDRSRIVLLDTKERALRSLKDLELDYAMGKVSIEDFEPTKRALTLEIAAVLKELKDYERA
jgi:hypothetical protein